MTGYFEKITVLFILGEKAKWIIEKLLTRINRGGGSALQSDFSETYILVVQNVEQVFHWNNDQATLPSFGCYCSHNDGNIQIKSFVVISKFLHRDTVTVHLFQKHWVT